MPDVSAAGLSGQLLAEQVDELVGHGELAREFSAPLVRPWVPLALAV